MNFADMTLKAVADNGSFSAVMSAPIIDREHEIVDPGAFLPLRDHIPILLFHDQKQVAGSGKPFYEGQLLKVNGTFASTEHGRMARALVIEGHLRHMSVGFSKPEVYTDKAGIRHITRADLLEASFVPVPANLGAEVISARSASRISTARGYALERARAEIVLAEVALALYDEPRIDFSAALRTNGPRRAVNDFLKSLR